jgi:pimeloyl-ACP methyl ester carboxylesterase
MKTLLRIFLAILLILLLVLAFNIQPNRDMEALKAKYTNAESRFLELDGMQVHYRDEGQGYPIVLIHGTGASLHTWDAWTEDLKRHFRVIRMDLPAFGLTGPHPDRDYSLAQYVAFLDALAEKLNLSTFHLVGNSLGGSIAWLYAARHPEAVNKLILLDPGGYHPGRKSPGAIKITKKATY